MIVYSSKDKNVKLSDGRVLPFYCGDDLNGVARALCQLLDGVLSLQEAYTDITGLNTVTVSLPASELKKQVAQAMIEAAQTLTAEAATLGDLKEQSKNTFSRYSEAGARSLAADTFSPFSAENAFKIDDPYAEVVRGLRPATQIIDDPVKSKGGFKQVMETPPFFDTNITTPPFFEPPVKTGGLKKHAEDTPAEDTPADASPAERPGRPIPRISFGIFKGLPVETIKGVETDEALCKAAHESLDYAKEGNNPFKGLEVVLFLPGTVHLSPVFSVNKYAGRFKARNADSARMKKDKAMNYLIKRADIVVIHECVTPEAANKILSRCVKSTTTCISSGFLRDILNVLDNQEQNK